MRGCQLFIDGWLHFRVSIASSMVSLQCSFSVHADDFDVIDFGGWILWMDPNGWMSGNRSSLKIDLITEDPKYRKLYCIEKSITNNRNTGNKSLYNCTTK